MRHAFTNPFILSLPEMSIHESQAGPTWLVQSKMDRHAFHPFDFVSNGMNQPDQEATLSHHKGRGGWAKSFPNQLGASSCKPACYRREICSMHAQEQPNTREQAHIPFGLILCSCYEMEIYEMDYLSNNPSIQFHINGK